ncbi:hypothetical protein Q3G72_012957 [Acer saccharum]|nr:hypothetical protein Q3G72_012957 [Acer saccharum]
MVTISWYDLLHTVISPRHEGTTKSWTHADLANQGVHSSTPSKPWIIFDLSNSHRFHLAHLRSRRPAPLPSTPTPLLSSKSLPAGAARLDAVILSLTAVFRVAAW